MNRTREDFCRRLLDESPHEALDPETLAARFVRYFNVPARPTMDELRSLLKRTGFGEVSGRHLDVKGIHYSAPGGGYDIHYREDMWAGTQDYSVVHETLWDMNSGSPPDRIVCRQAERFAAAVLMQPRAFEPLALEWWPADSRRQHRGHHAGPRGAQAADLQPGGLPPVRRPHRAGNWIAEVSRRRKSAKSDRQEVT